MRTLGLLFMLTMAPGVHAYDAELYLQLSSHMVKVMAADADGRMSSGSGVLIDDHHIVTNCHVVGRASHVIVARGSYGVPVSARTADTRHDLCVMNSATTMGNPAPLSASRELKVGDTVRAVGFSGGRALSISEGRVIALHEMDGAQVIETDAFFKQGASGGALFDEQNRVVGVLTFFVPGLQRNFAVPVEWVKKGLAEARDIELPLQMAAAPFWAAEDHDKPFFLRAIQLENEGNWNGLRAVAREWADAEPDSRGAIEAAVKASRLPPR
ncbi:S1 family peptidase [Methyloversatilis thermotolerans]|uniref:S1 family peptidase n=1 Tax=Methyloversatilis thermotolerans TaxID=1346290 RepID=UPI000381F818|nr:serine protease [Methyloversatilis thermotolerans]